MPSALGSIDDIPTARIDDTVLADAVMPSFMRRLSGLGKQKDKAGGEQWKHSESVPPRNINNTGGATPRDANGSSQPVTHSEATKQVCTLQEERVHIRYAVSRPMPGSKHPLTICPWAILFHRLLTC